MFQQEVGLVIQGQDTKTVLSRVGQEPSPLHRHCTIGSFTPTTGQERERPWERTHGLQTQVVLCLFSFKTAISMATLTHHGVRGRQEGRSETGTQHSHFRACAGRQCKAWGAACRSAEQSSSLAFHWVQGRKKTCARQCGGLPLTFSFGTESGLQSQVIRTLLICSAARSGDLRLASSLDSVKHREWSATFFSNTILGKGVARSPNSC